MPPLKHICRASAGAPTISLTGEQMSVAARSARSRASNRGTTLSNFLSIDLSGACNHTAMEQQIFMLQAKNARLLKRVGSLEHELAAEKVETRVVEEQLSLVKHLLGNGQIASSLSAALPNSSNFISGRPQQFLSGSRTDPQHNSGVGQVGVPPFSSSHYVGTQLVCGGQVFGKPCLCTQLHCIIFFTNYMYFTVWPKSTIKCCVLQLGSEMSNRNSFTHFSQL